MKIRLILFTLLLSVSAGYAQQDPQYSQYMFNPLVINPAYAGNRNVLSAALVHRSQWAGVSGAPTTQSLGVHAPVWKQNFAMGLSLVHDAIGPSNSIAIDLAYAYRIKLGLGKLAFGLRTGAYYQRFDWTKIEYKDPNEVYALGNTSTHWVPNFDFGMMYNDNKTFVGLTVAHLTEPRFGIVDSGVDTITYNANLSMHANFIAGHAFEMNENWVIRPSVLAKSTFRQDGVADLNCSFVYNNKLWVGVTLRTRYGAILITEYQFTDNIRAGYSFDMTMNRLTQLNAFGSHEIFIGYDLSLSKDKTLSPRYF